MSESIIYFKELEAESELPVRILALQKIIAALKWEKIIGRFDRVAIKTHFGDVNNTTHIAPELIREIVRIVKKNKAYPFLTETSTLYAGPRQNAITHTELAYKHGFSFDNVEAPIIMSDGLMGNTEIEVEINGLLYKKVRIARDAILADALILMTHPTGHILTGLGATLKNLGMGLSSRKGKLQQHSSIKPYIKEDACTFCRQCIVWCPEEAIITRHKKAFIVKEKCIGCGECLSVCKYNAVKFNWGVQSGDIQKRIAEYALGAIINKKTKCIYINVLADMTKECDCLNKTQKPFIRDIGIIAGYDPVALDQATLDLTREYTGKDIGRGSNPGLDPEIQLDHGEKIGLGSRKYRLKKL